jgi:hypothetical protein
MKDAEDSNILTAFYSDGGEGLKDKKAKNNLQGSWIYSILLIMEIRFQKVVNFQNSKINSLYSSSRHERTDKFLVDEGVDGCSCIISSSFN